MLAEPIKIKSIVQLLNEEHDAVKDLNSVRAEQHANIKMLEQWREGAKESTDKGALFKKYIEMEEEKTLAEIEAAWKIIEAKEKIVIEKRQEIIKALNAEFIEEERT